jgi:hypothetical protein
MNCDEDVWVEILSYLEVPNMCRVERVSRWYRALVASLWKHLDRRDDATTTNNNAGKSMAWTAKERVCRLYLASNYANEILVLSEPNNKQIDGLCQGCCNYALFQSDNLFLGMMEYFVCISKHDNSSYGDSCVIVWKVFLPATCRSIRLDAIQEQIHNRRDDDDGWDKWSDLLHFLNENQQDFLSVDDDSSNHERKHKIQAIANDYSILVLGMELLTGWKLHRIMDSRPGNGHLVIHLDDNDYHRHNQGYYDALQASIIQDITDDPTVEHQACLHVWIRMSSSESARLTVL